MSDWIKKEKTLCPLCSDPINTIMRSRLANNTICFILAADPKLKRSEEIIKELDEHDIFTHQEYQVQKEVPKVFPNYPSPPQGLFGQVPAQGLFGNDQFQPAVAKNQVNFGLPQQLPAFKSGY